MISVLVASVSATSKICAAGLGQILHNHFSSLYLLAMRQGQFTKDQRLYIESYFDAFTAALDRGLEGKKLTEWKQKTASELLASPQLADLNLSETPRKDWFEVSSDFYMYHVFY
jgi:hypothetical protein